MQFVGAAGETARNRFATVGPEGSVRARLVVAVLVVEFMLFDSRYLDRNQRALCRHHPVRLFVCNF